VRIKFDILKGQAKFYVQLILAEYIYIGGNNATNWLGVYRPNKPTIAISAHYCTTIQQNIEYWANMIAEVRNHTIPITIATSKEECRRMRINKSCKSGKLTGKKGQLYTKKQVYTHN
jgi:hypothetical protein